MSGTPDVNCRRLGADAETRAAQLMQRSGLRILLRPYRWRGGELDLIARRGELLVVAEVRLRASERYGGAAASITAGKRHRIRLTTQRLLQHCPRLAQLTVRFDVVLAAGAEAPLQWLQGVM